VEDAPQVEAALDAKIKNIVEEMNLN
jgi:hypothetical protein